MALRRVRGDHCGTMSEVELTCDREGCTTVAVTTRDIVPEGWLEIRTMGGFRIDHVPFSKAPEDHPPSAWLCCLDCVVLHHARLAAEADNRLGRRHRSRAGGDVSRHD